MRAFCLLIFCRSAVIFLMHHTRHVANTMAK